MKYKVVSFILIVSLIVGSIFLNFYYKKDLKQVFHQHTQSKDYSSCFNIEDCSHLPIVNINLNNQIIPTKYEENNYIITDVDIYDNGINILGNNKESYKARLRYRGRSSLRFDKKGYSLKFINEKDEKKNIKFLGMPKDSDWVLHGPFIDKTLIRNYMWYNISQEIMTDAPKVRLFELYVDYKYQGVYVAIEAVTRGDNSRIKMDKINKDSMATSYLIQLDNYEANPITDLNSLSKYTYKINTLTTPLALTIKYPEESDLKEDVKKYILDDFSKFEKMLYSFDYKEYGNYIDIDSFVDYFIINEFTQNYDAGHLSTYIYKDIFGKYKMYVWDFNSANNNYQIDLLENQRFAFDKNLWFEMLLKDPDFTEAIISRYKSLRKSYLSDEYLDNYIDEVVEYLGPAIERNFSVWGYTLEEDYKKFKTNYMPNSYEDAIKQLKESIHKRGEWMDKNIDTLRQYSHPSKNKKYNK